MTTQIKHKMTKSEKFLISVIEKQYRDCTPGALVEILLRIGVVDRTLCNTLAIREHVAARVKAGAKKIEAMREASDMFGCSLANVKKCEYYNTNVNLI